jgi:HK97 family phage major capsid protein
MSAELHEKLQAIQQQIVPFVARHDQQSKELQARVLTLEQMAVSRPGAPGAPSAFSSESVGATIAKSEGLASFRKGGKSSGQIEIGSFRKAVVIVSAPWSTAPDYRPTMAAPAQPRLPLRSLLPSFGTVSNMIEFPRETARSGSPDYAYPEGSDKAVGDFTYVLVQCPVATVAFWIACSRQVIDDSAALVAYIDNRLLYLLEAKVENEILFGDGASGHLNGICTQATPASGAPSDLITASAHAISQLAASGFTADFVVANATDWWGARQLKSTIGTFLIGDPLNPLPPTLWGLSVSLSPSMPAGKFLVGVRNEAAIADRQSATIELSREHASYFTQNLVAILCEERMTVVVYRPEAFVFGQVASVGS